MINTKALISLFFVLGSFNSILNVHADSFSLQQFSIDGTSIGDKQHKFLRNMQQLFPGNNKVKSTHPDSLIFARPVSCSEKISGHSRCEGKFAEMQQAVNKQQKRFINYRDVVAEFNDRSELVFLSTITTTAHHNKEACLVALSEFYQQAVNNSVEPTVIYPRNQLDIYYIKIDEAPFTTRIMGKLNSAFSMVWQKARSDWSAFYSSDFGCRDSGYMVVNETLYDKSRKTDTDSNAVLQVSNLDTN